MLAGRRGPHVQCACGVNIHVLMLQTSFCRWPAVRPLLQAMDRPRHRRECCVSPSCLSGWSQSPQAYNDAAWGAGNRAPASSTQRRRCAPLVCREGRRAAPIGDPPARTPQWLSNQPMAAVACEAWGDYSGDQMSDARSRLRFWRIGCKRCARPESSLCSPGWRCFRRKRNCYAADGPCLRRPQRMCRCMCGLQPDTHR